MRKLRIVLIAMFAAIILALSGVMYYVIHFDNPFASFISFDKAKNVNTQIKKLDNIKGLNFKMENSDITFYKGQDPDIVIKEYTNSRKKGKFVTCKETEGILDVTLNDYAKKHLNIFNDVYYEIKVYLPETYHGDLRVNSEEGDIKSEDVLSLNNCNIATEHGDIEIDTLVANKNEITSADSDINIHNLRGASQITMNGAGDINVNHNDGDITITNISGSGDIEVINYSGKVDITNSNGDIGLNLKGLTDDVTVKTDNGDIEGYFPEKSQFVFNAVTGNGDITTYFDTQLKFNKDNHIGEGKIGSKAKIKVNLKTGNGDIDIAKK